MSSAIVWTMNAFGIVCLAVLVALLVAYIRKRRRLRAAAVHRTPRPGRSSTPSQPTSSTFQLSDRFRNRAFRGPRAFDRPAPRSPSPERPDGQTARASLVDKANRPTPPRTSQTAKSSSGNPRTLVDRLREGASGSTSGRADDEDGEEPEWPLAGRGPKRVRPQQHHTMFTHPTMAGETLRAETAGEAQRTSVNSEEREGWWDPLLHARRQQDMQHSARQSIQRAHEIHRPTQGQEEHPPGTALELAKA